MSYSLLSACLGTQAHHALRPKPDHPIGAGQDFAIKVSLPGMDHDVAQSLIDGSHWICPYFHATGGTQKISSCLA